MRFKKLQLDKSDNSQKELAERVLTVSSDGTGGPFNLLLRSPAVGHKIMDMLDYFNDQSEVLDPLCRRLAVLILSRSSGVPYAWWTHQRRALKGGEFTQGQIDAINRRERPPGLSPKLLATANFVSELIGKYGTSDATFTALRQHSEEDEVVELIALCGTYTTVAFLLREGKVTLPDGEVDTLNYD